MKVPTDVKHDVVLDLLTTARCPQIISASHQGHGSRTQPQVGGASRLSLTQPRRQQPSRLLACCSRPTRGFVQLDPHPERATTAAVAAATDGNQISTDYFPNLLPLPPPPVPPTASRKRYCSNPISSLLNLGQSMKEKGMWMPWKRNVAEKRRGRRKSRR